MKGLLFIAAALGTISFGAEEWRPVIQDRGEAIYDLKFDSSGAWAVSGGGNGGGAVFRLWSASANACVWKFKVAGAALGNTMDLPAPVGVLGDLTSLVGWTEARRSEGAEETHWLALIAPSGELVWKVKTPRGGGVLSNDRTSVGFPAVEEGGAWSWLQISDQTIKNGTSPNFGTGPSIVHYRSASLPTESGRIIDFEVSDNNKDGVTLVASENGLFLWSREVETGEGYVGGYGDLVTVSNRPRHDLIGWSYRGTLEILDSSTGEVLFEKQEIDGRFTLVSPTVDSDELWLSSTPVKDGGTENSCESILAKVSLDGSSRITAVPIEGFLSDADKCIVVEDRYLICANFNGPQAIWCWDLATLSLMWYHKGAGEIWVEGGLAYQDGIVFVDWTGTTGSFESRGLEDGLPVAETSAFAGKPEDERSLDEAIQTRLRQLGFSEEESWRDSVTVTFPDGREGMINLYGIPSGGQWIPIILRDENAGRMAVVNLKTGYEVTLLVQQDEPRFPAWLVVDEKGRFEGSPGSGSLVAMCSGTSVFPIDQFAASLNRPDEILSLLGTSTEKIVSQFRARLDQRRGSLPPSPVDQANLPSVKILEVKQNNGIASLSYQTNQAGNALSALQIYVNGVPYFGREGKPFDAQGSMTLEFPLSSGNNKIELECIDSAGQVSPRAVHHITNSTPVSAGRIHYLGIGCSEYADPSVPDLAFAHQDAADMQAAISRMAPDAAGSSTVLTNRDATGLGIKASLSSLKDVGVEDTVVIFLAGHGIQHDASYYLMPYDVDLVALSDTGVSFETVEEALYACPARRKLLLIDTCASGQFASDVLLAGVTEGLKVTSRSFAPRSLSGATVRLANQIAGSSPRPRFSDNDLFRRSGTVVISSCAADEVSLESDLWKNGVFTEALLKTFDTPAADTDNSGSLDKHELLAHCRNIVSELVAGLEIEGLRQSPSLDRDNLAEPLELPLFPQEAADERIKTDGNRINYEVSVAKVLGGSAKKDDLVETNLDVEQGAPRKKPAGMKEDAPAPPARPVEPSQMATVGVAGYVWSANGALVWNNFPKATDVAHWNGAVNEKGFASGGGILRWFKGDRYLTGYMGVMIDGKLEGKTISEDADGSISEVWWKDGKKVKK